MALLIVAVGVLQALLVSAVFRRGGGCCRYRTALVSRSPKTFNAVSIISW